MNKKLYFCRRFYGEKPIAVSRGKQVRILHSTRCCMSLKDLKLQATVCFGWEGNQGETSQKTCH